MRIQRLAKQVLDRILAFVLLVLLTPLLVVVVAWILVDSGRPVFFVYPRAGRFGRPFPMLKFRTMIPDAIEVGRTQKLSADPFGLLAEDPRITRSGRFLRRTSFDELPQLLNVTAGHMSLVGPRPEREHFVNDLAKKIPYFRQRHIVKPGLTGWAQINYRYGSTHEDAVQKLQYDLFYIKNLSLALDVFIMLNTIKTVLLRRGA